MAQAEIQDPIDFGSLVVAEESKEVLVQAFTQDRIDELVDEVREKVLSVEPDLSTAGSRGEIASRAHKVSKFKVRLDDMGKELVSDEKKKIDAVNASRKRARDKLDALRDEVRQPLTEWEAAEAERLRLEKEAIELECAQIEALEMDSLWERERQLAIREAQLAEQERVAREAREAEERAAREAQEAQERERRERELRESHELERRQRAEREAQEAKDRKVREEAERVEREARIAREAEERARLQMIAEQEERDRLARLEQQRLEKKAAQKRHMNKIRKEAAGSLAAIPDMPPGMAEDIIANIDAGLIPHVTINYL